MIFRPDLSALVGSPKQTNKEVKRANQSVRLCAANKSLFSAADTESRGGGGGGGGWVEQGCTGQARLPGSVWACLKGIDIS